MITKITTIKETFEDNILLFKQVKPVKINVLFGGNGVGKTTFLNGIINNTLNIKCNNNYKVVAFSNSKDNFRHNDPSPFDRQFNNKLIQKVESNSMSEGQSIIFSINDFLEKVKDELNNTEDTVVIVLDEVDSGLSAENINMVMHFILDIYNNYDNVQFFISSNAYHFVYVFKNVLSMYTGRFVTINSYEEFYKLLADNMVELGQKRDLKFLQSAKFV